MLFTCPCQEFVGSTHCKASGSNTKRLVLKVGQWEQLGSWKDFGAINYIYVRLGTPEQCASAKNANEVKLKKGKTKLSRVSNADLWARVTRTLRIRNDAGAFTFWV